ncbi:MAG: molecular chaperone DnaJ [Alphaproteobacteria bacterium]
MADKQDFYELLGVSKNASKDELKKAYRKQAMAYHPDRNPGDAKAEEKFKELSHAYDILSDDQKRAAYDRFGHDAFNQGAGGFGGGAGAAGFDFSSGFADIFEDLFGAMGSGGRGGARGPARGADLRYDLRVSLEDAFRGKQETIKVTTAVACGSCDGSGSEKGSKPITCTACNGAGRTRVSQGFFTMERTCSHCGGTGEVIKNPCRTCAGSGRMRKEKSLSVTIPPGVEDGTRIRLAGEGEVGARGAPPGDLYIFLNVKPHHLFERDGADIHCRTPLKMTTATLGGSVEVPTIDGGKVKVTIPEGTQSGHQFRLRGKGMSVLRSSHRGDMYIHAQVETPTKLNKKQKDLLREFEHGDKGTSPQTDSFFDKVKDFWEDLKE